MSSYQERFNGAADAIGLCDKCPKRPIFYLDMADSGGGAIPIVWLELGDEASKSCARAQEIQNDQNITSPPLDKCPPPIED